MQSRLRQQESSQTMTPAPLYAPHTERGLDNLTRGKKTAEREQRRVKI